MADTGETMPRTARPTTMTSADISAVKRRERKGRLGSVMTSYPTFAQAAFRSVSCDARRKETCDSFLPCEVRVPSFATCVRAPFLGPHPRRTPNDIDPIFRSFPVGEVLTKNFLVSSNTRAKRNDEIRVATHPQIIHTVV